MVHIAVINRRPKSKVPNVIRRALETAIKELTLDYSAIDAVQHLNLETQRPDILVLHEPWPIHDYIDLVQRLGLAKNTIITWSATPAPEVQEELRLEFDRIGVPTKCILGSGSTDLLISMARDIESSRKR